jgi:succinate dehydrogenase / fumarate reductase, iron-sulfur subunit
MSCANAVSTRSIAVPRIFLFETAYLEMHPLNSQNRLPPAYEEWGIGYNITKCYTKVCPEEIEITDNASLL